MLPTLDLGPVTLPTAALVSIFGIWLALSAVERAAARLNLSVSRTYTLAASAVAAGFAAARLTFVALRWETYRDNLLGIVWPLTSGYQLEAGLIAALATAFFYARGRRLPAWPTLDALAPGLVVALLVISVADLLAGPGFGEQADLFWSINLFGVRRHPVQIYEIVAGLLALLAWRQALRVRGEPGLPFLVAVATVSAGRLITDAYRANALLTAGGYHTIQILSLGALVVSLWLMARRAPISV
jgi:phosphatidylglycerol:prolipoprotein diacylglycerol transferase